eukprot:scaffold180044_cov13-Tisochrysis_lutea.AAC.1
MSAASLRSSACCQASSPGPFIGSVVHRPYETPFRQLQPMTAINPQHEATSSAVLHGSEMMKPPAMLAHHGSGMVKPTTMLSIMALT